MEIRIDYLIGPEIQLLLREHLENMAKLSPPESIHALALEQLRKPEITFWTAWSGHELLGCGALKELDPQQGEIKSVRIVSKHRKQGVASALLTTILQQAKKTKLQKG
jgi:putative acetyltransferase